jgi:hypothetical protein
MSGPYPSNSVTETLITAIDTLGGPPPTSYGLGELMRDFDNALATFTGGVAAVVNIDGTITVTTLLGTVTISRAAISGAITIAAGSNVATLNATPTTEATIRAIALQDATRRGGSVEPNLSDGMTHYAVVTNITNSGTTITVTSTVNPPVGGQVTIAGSTGFTTNNPNGTWVVTAVTATTFTAVVTNAPTGSFGTPTLCTASYIAPVLDAIFGDSIPFGEGAHNAPGIGFTDNQTVLKTMENRAAGFPDPGRGFRRCQAPFFGPDTWNNLAVGSQVTASGPIAAYDTSWQLTTTGQVIGDTQPFRRAVVFFKRRTNGDGVQVSFNGGSTFTATQDTNGTGYFMVDSGDLGTIQSRVLQVAWEAHVSGSGGGGLEVAGYCLYMTEGLTGSYNHVLAAAGTTAQMWVANTDWDTYWLPMIQPRRVIWCVGVNDLAVAGRTVVQLTTDLTTLVTRSAAAAPLAEIVLVAEYHPGSGAYNTGITGANWNTQFVQPLNAVADANGCTFIDLNARIGDVSVAVGDSGDPYGLTQSNGVLGSVGDGVHLGNAVSSWSGRDGQRALAETYWEKLSYAHPYQPVADPGWTPDLFAWTRFSGTVFLVPNQFAQRFAPGTKVRWAESGTVKYGTVTSAVLQTGPVTAVSLASTSDYVMTANPDLGSNWYSYEAPPDFPGAFAWAAALTGVTGGVPITVFSINGRQCTCTLFWTAPGTGTATTFTATAPLNASSAAIAMGVGQDNGVQVSVSAQIIGASSTINLGNPTLATWTAAGVRYGDFTLVFPI